MRLHATLNYLLVGLDREYPDLARAVRKWSAFLLHAVESASYATEIPAEDILQDIMVGLCKVNDMHRKPLWRYEGHLYEIIDFDGQSVLIQTLSHNTKQKYRMWADSKNLKPVDLSKIESNVYREIHQQYIDHLNAHYTAKRGYQTLSCSEKIVKVRSGRRVEARKKVVRNVKRVVHLVDIDIPHTHDLVDTSLYPSGREIHEYLSDPTQNPERTVISDEFICTLGTSLTPTALLVLGCLVDDPGACIWEISKTLGLSHHYVLSAKKEIAKRYLRLAGTTDRVSLFAEA